MSEWLTKNLVNEEADTLAETDSDEFFDDEDLLVVSEAKFLAGTIDRCGNAGKN